MKQSTPPTKMWIISIKKDIQKYTANDGRPALIITMGIPPVNKFKIQDLSCFPSQLLVSIEEIMTPEYLQFIKDGALLVFKGLEPLLQEKSILKFVHFLNEQLPSTKIEIELETTGMIQPESNFIEDDLSDIVNSLVLKPMAVSERVKYGVENRLPFSLFPYQSFNFVVFVFVMSMDNSSKVEGWLALNTDIKKRSIMVPSAKTNKTLAACRIWLQKFCIENMAKYQEVPNLTF